MFWMKRKSQLAAMLSLATKRGNTGGLFKRIDENRELLELMRRECPEFLINHCWVEGWIRGNDIFFNELQAILQLQVDQHDGFSGGSPRRTEDGSAIRLDGSIYPRPWPDSRSGPATNAAALASENTGVIAPRAPAGS